MTNRATIETLAGWLAAQDDIVLLGHVSPDGDTTGSCLGLWHALNAMGKRAVACLPGGVSKLYAALPGASQVVPTGEPLPFEPVAALSVDVSDYERLGEAGMALFERCPHRAAMDHHATNPGFGELMVLDGRAAAVGEMAVSLIEAMGVRLSREMAECLFVAISTDCGQFSYSNTRRETFEAAGKCVEAGIDLAGITETLYRTRTLSRTRLLARVLSGIEISEDGRMAWARLTEAMLRECGATWEENEGIVNYLREIEGVEFGMLVEQRGDKTKLSMRSGKRLDVANAVAAPLGGGGHHSAAGALLETDMESAIRQALALARAALEGVHP